MKIKLRMLNSLNKWIKVSLPVAVIGFQFALPAAQADTNSISVNNASTFALQDVSYSKGTDSAYLQFGLKLQNGGQNAMDMNDYGVEVSDKNGYSYTARLTSQQSAAVAGGQSATFRFSSQIPTADTPDQLQVVVFRWDMSKPNLMDELGHLSVAGAATSSAVGQTVVQVNEADSSLPSDAAVNFRAVRTFIVHENDQSYLYTDLLATNNGSSSFSLPAGLKYRFIGSQSDSYNATVVAGTDTPLLPGETRKVTVKSAISSGQPRAAVGYSLQFYTESANGESVLGSVDVARFITESVIGEAEPAFSRNGTKQLTYTTTNAMTSEQDDGLHISVTVVATNQSTDIVELPALSGAFQFGNDGAAVPSKDTASHPAYLSANGSESYHFEAVLPSGLKADEVRLALFAQVNGSSTSASSTTPASPSAGGSTSTNASSDAASTPTANASSSSGLSGASSSMNSSTAASTASKASGSLSSGPAVSTGGGIPVAVNVLTGAADATDLFKGAKQYNIGNVLSLNKEVISSDLDVSLVEFHVNPDDNDGFRNAFAKFVVTNHGKSAETFPAFSTELVADNGASYDGSRQTSVATKIMPGTSYTVNYTYLLPSTLNTDQLALTMADSGSGVPSADVAISPQSAADGTELQTYPFKVTLNNTALQWTYSGGTYTYQLSLDLKLERQPQVIVDTNSSSLEFDLVDGLGRTLATQTAPFTGTGMLIDGLQTINFGGFKSVSDPLSVRVYETFSTADGTVKRLLKEINNP